MKKARLLCILGMTFGLLMLTPIKAWAITTPISPGATGEPTLYGPTGLLNTLYGWSNLTRVDDLNDQLWSVLGTGAYVHPAAKYAYFAQDLYAGPNPLFTVPSSPYNVILPTGPAYEYSITTAGVFDFINDPVGSPDPPAWSSIAGLNPTYQGMPVGMDRMVTYYIHSSTYTGDYVMCWEDGIDKDYNDMVYRLHYLRTHVIPEPTSMALLGLGLLGFVGGLIKRKI